MNKEAKKAKEEFEKLLKENYFTEEELVELLKKAREVLFPKEE